ncbi:hypothetical protein DL770_000174 [Monosporascus sp. CRB-9-2]|nr:hypothetical protein DL770_000174 [Monosporascus sp. CRB-9-2]
MHQELAALDSLYEVAESCPNYVGHNLRTPSPPRNRDDHGELALLGAADDDSRPLTAAEMNATKYFHEPWGMQELGHYYKRYFRGEGPYEEHPPALRLLIRSCFAVCRELGVESVYATQYLE